jgi:hypothetical protein
MRNYYTEGSTSVTRETHSCNFHIRGEVRFIDGTIIPSAVVSKMIPPPPLDMGRVRDILSDAHLSLSANEVMVASDNPRVMVWVGNSGDHTLPTLPVTPNSLADRVWACYDGDLNKKCDFAENDAATTCLAYGGDYFKDVCCGRLSAGDWAWFDKNNFGEIFGFDYCPGKSFVSDGINIFSCDSSAAQTSFFDIATKYGTHEYICSEGRLYECSAGAPFSTTNSASLGSTTQGLAGSVCPMGMIAYWPLDDSADNVRDTFAHGVPTVYISYADGIINRAAVFASPHSDIEVSHSIVDITMSSFSAEVWIKPVNSSGKHTIFNKELSYELYIDDNKLKASLYSSGSPASVFLESAYPITNGVWSHVVLVYDGSKARIYHNGLEVASGDLSGNINSSSKPFIIGARSFSPTENFEGLIDEVAIYSRVLDTTTISDHYSNPGPYCYVSSINETYYCASDGDWTEDLDSKDELSCHSAGFNWTGHACCGEADDPGESYSDFSSSAVDFSTIIIDENNVNKISDYELILDQDNSFVTVKGPARVSVVWTSFRPGREGNVVKCADERIASFDILANKTKRIENLFYPDKQYCTIGKAFVTSLPILASGGCFDEGFYPSGSFLFQKNIINYQGEFIACKQIPSAYQSYDFISVHADHCKQPLLNITQNKHVVCLPDGDWVFTDDAGFTFADDTLWDPDVMGVSNAYKYGCCPADQCWNGTGCQIANTFYTVNNQGFVCK